MATPLFTKLRAAPALLYFAATHTPQHLHGYTVCRWYALSRSTTGTKQWEEVRARRGREMDLDELCETTLANLERCRLPKRSSMTKIYDCVTNSEELSQAEKVLTSFRRGLSLPRPSLPLALVRACIRVGKPRKALHYISNKVQYGVFPSQRVYTVLMDGLLSNKDTKGVFSAYKQLLADEIVPGASVYYMVAMAHALEGNPEGIEKALEMSGRSQELNLKVGTEAYRDVVKTLLSEDHVERATEVVKKLERDDLIPRQTVLNLKVHCLTKAGDLGEAVSLLDEEVCLSESGELGVPREAFPQLVEAVRERGEAATQEALQALTQKLEDLGKLPLSPRQPSPSNTPDPVE